MYNKFSCSRYSRVEQHPPESRQRHRAIPQQDRDRHQPSCTAEHPRRESGPLGSILPPGVDAGDILFLLVLLFLYLESEDEEFLIILIVVGLSVFRGENKGGVQSLLSSLL